MRNEVNFAIAFWVGPEFTEEGWKELAECGFSVAPLMVNDRDEGLRALDLCAKHGMRAYVFDRRLPKALDSDGDWRPVVAGSLPPGLQKKSRARLHARAQIKASPAGKVKAKGYAKNR